MNFKFNILFLIAILNFSYVNAQRPKVKKQTAIRYEVSNYKIKVLDTILIKFDTIGNQIFNSKGTQVIIVRKIKLDFDSINNISHYMENSYDTLEIFEQSFKDSTIKIALKKNDTAYKEIRCFKNKKLKSIYKITPANKKFGYFGYNYTITNFYHTKNKKTTITQSFRSFSKDTSTKKEIYHYKSNIIEFYILDNQNNIWELNKKYRFDKEKIKKGLVIKSKRYTYIGIRTDKFFKEIIKTKYNIYNLISQKKVYYKGKKYFIIEYFYEYY